MLDMLQLFWGVEFEGSSFGVVFYISKKTWVGRRRKSGVLCVKLPERVHMISHSERYSRPSPIWCWITTTQSLLATSILDHQPSKTIKDMVLSYQNRGQSGSRNVPRTG